MSDIMTLFTANMPASIFNQLFDESQTADNACPFLTLVRYPEQKEVDEWGTEAPIQDFKTGFLGKNDDEIRQYFRRFFSERPPSEQGMIVENWMAVLDDQSAVDSTIVLHYGMKKSMWDDLHEYEPDKEVFGEGKLCEDGYIWWKWRVPFKHSYSFFIAVEHCDFEILELLCRPEHRNSQGIVDYETCWKIICGDIRDPLGKVGGQREASPEA